MRIAKEGYYGGDPQKVLEAPVDMVMTLIEYTLFQNEYERISYVINSEDK